jgi:hypothetical protein
VCARGTAREPNTCEHKSAARVGPTQPRSADVGVLGDAVERAIELLPMLGRACAGGGMTIDRFSALLRGPFVEDKAQIRIAYTYKPERHPESVLQARSTVMSALRGPAPTGRSNPIILNPASSKWSAM